MVTQIFQVCIIPLLGILTKYFIDFLNAKREELKAKTDSEIAKKYTDIVTETVMNCVIATNQTYVDSLKNSNAFDGEHQAEAFNKTMLAVLTILNDDVKKYITEATGDLNTYLTQLIEAQVNVLK